MRKKPKKSAFFVLFSVAKCPKIWYDIGDCGVVCFGEENI